MGKLKTAIKGIEKKYKIQKDAKNLIDLIKQEYEPIKKEIDKKKYKKVKVKERVETKDKKTGKIIVKHVIRWKIVEVDVDKNIIDHSQEKKARDKYRAELVDLMKQIKAEE